MKNYKTIALFFLAILIAAFLHSYNMLHFPYYESDEGTYVSQAWSVVKEGELSPYTYWYDHPPMGWHFIALWVQLFDGDFFKFGTSIDTARVFMLFIHVLSAALIFFITQKVTKSYLASFLASLLFSISPLAIYFHRRVLLDNMMTFWILASIAVLFIDKIKLRHYMLSGAFYALAVLTKITAVMFGPAILIFILIRKCGVSKIFRSIAWLTVSILATSLFVLYAFLKGEFFPQDLTSGVEHVSLVSTILFQMSRSSGVEFYQGSSDFMVAVRDWINKDVFIVIFSVATVVFSTVASYWYKNLIFFTLSSLLYIMFLIRGGVVINFYFIPLIPFISLSFSILLNNIVNTFLKKRWQRTAILISVIVGISTYYVFFGIKDVFLRDETIQQKNATVWIKENLPADASIIIDVYSLVELRDPDYVNDKVFVNADWFYKINKDPQIRDKKYKGNWRQFEYVALTHEMLKEIEKDENPIIKEAYKNSLPVAKWVSNSFAHINEQKFISTNGDWAMIYAVNGTSKMQLLDSWNYYKNNFVHSYGQVIDPSNQVTTSEGQSYAMMRAVWMNDKDSFEGIWRWTEDHMQYRLDDKLFSWKWQDDELVDTGNATDADQDIAIALLFGYKVWGDEKYLVAAKEVINDIWDHAVVDIADRYYLLAMRTELAERWDGYLFNPSYLSPAWYRIFAEVDPEHDWLQLVQDSYDSLNDLGKMSDNATYLPPDWVLINTKDGSFHDAGSHFDRVVHNFGFDSFRTLWRVSMDYAWNQSAAAAHYLENINKYLTSRYARYGYIPAEISSQGVPILGFNSLATDSGYLSSLMYYENESVPIGFYNKFLEDKFDSSNRYWGRADDYYGSNWAWFSSGLYNDDLPNLWVQTILK